MAIWPFGCRTLGRHGAGQLADAAPDTWPTRRWPRGRAGARTSACPTLATWPLGAGHLAGSAPASGRPRPPGRGRPSILSQPACPRRPCGPRGRCRRSRCSGRGCPRARSGPRPRSGRGFASQQRRRRDQHAGRAEAALDAALLEERALQRVQLVAVGEALDRRDLAAVGLQREVGARVHGLAVEQHHAGAALGVVAALLGAGQADLVAHHRQQASVPGSTSTG